MRITMQKAESLTLEQMREFLAASEELDLALARRTEIYDLVERTLRKQRYLELAKKDKGVVRRYLAKLSGRSLPHDHSSDSTVSPKRRRAGEPTPTAAFPDPLHGRRHRLAGSGRRRPRRALGAGGASHPVAGIHRLQQGRLPTVSLDLGIPHLQLAADRGLSSTPRPSHQDPQPWGEHRRAAQARPARPTRLLAGRHRRIRATPRRARGSTTSTPSIRSRSGRSWAVARPSRKPM